MLMKSIGLAATERKVSCSSVDGTSSPFPLFCWPSVGAVRAHHRFPGCWVNSSVQVQKPSGWFGDRGTKFSSLGGIKVTQAHTPAWARSRPGAVSNTESRCLWTCGYLTVRTHKVCVLNPTGLWAFFPLIHTRLHPLHTFHTCLWVYYLVKIF